MTEQWIIFFITAILLTAALFCFTFAVIGVYRFGFMLNRMHAGSIGDSMGLLLAISAVIAATGLKLDSLKLLLLIVFMWFTSPASSHFLSQVEYYTNEQLFSFTGRIRKDRDEDGKESGNI